MEIEKKLLNLEKLYLSKKKYYDDKYKIYWEGHDKNWNKRLGGTLRILKKIPTIKNTISSLNLNENATILDICCGSPVLLHQIKNQFPKYNAYGIDIYTTEFDDFNENCLNGVKVFKFPFQMLFENNHKFNSFDLVMMYNSYRAFNESLKNKIKNWSSDNSKYSLLDQYE
tara:strand:- start:1229 stop:1738 length:510 start_codon:yes stop_codon:yes gene_type:complete